MIHDISDRLTRLVINNGWVSNDDFEWCSYALEKRISQILFLTVVMIWAAVRHLTIEALVFVIVFHSFRRRMGGWHAKHAWVCQLTSLALVILSVGYIGTFFLTINPNIIIVSDLLLLCYASFLKPEYPIQVHFTERETIGNIKKKNLLLLLILFLQCVTWIFLSVDIAVYSFVGLAVAVLSVIVPKIKLERGVQNETN